MPYLQAMCPKELEQAIKSKSPLFISVGSIEYHGSQLPLGTDLLIIEGILREVEKRAPIVVAPPFIYSPTGYMVSDAEKGTVDISIDGFIRYCSEILKAYIKMGFENIKVLVHHQGGNISAFVKTAIMQINGYNQCDELGDGWWTERKSLPSPCKIEVLPAVFGDNVSQSFGGHAGKGETQAIMALYPQMVHLENLTDHEPWWNETVKDASEEEAQIEMEKLINRWVEQLK